MAKALPLPLRYVDHMIKLRELRKSSREQKPTRVELVIDATAKKVRFMRHNNAGMNTVYDSLPEAINEKGKQ